MGLVLTTPPAQEPVTLTEAKEHLKVEHDADDSLITTYISASRQWCESFTHRAINEQTWTLHLNDFPWPLQIIRLPKGKCSAVNSIKYYDTAGVLQTLDVADYQTDLTSHIGGIIAPAPGKTFPSVESDRLAAVQIEFVAGYGDDPDDVPADLKAAFLYRLADIYEQRGSSDQPLGINTNAQEHLASGVAKTLLQPFVLREWQG